MSYATLIRQIEAGEGLGFVEARALGAALLDGGVPELETAAFLVAFNQHDPGLDAWLGLHAALAERLPDFVAPTGPFRTVVLPTYHGVRTHPHLTPLLALLLKSFGIPVLIHGVLEGGGGTAAAYVLRELGIMPCSSAAQVNKALQDDGIAFAPVALLSPGLAALLALRARLGIDGWVTRLAALADVLGERSVRVTPVIAGAEIASTRAVLEALGGQALLLQGCEGEAFADPLAAARYGAGAGRAGTVGVRGAIDLVGAGESAGNGCAGHRRVDRSGHARPSAAAAADPQPAGGVPVCGGVYRRSQSGACDHRDQWLWSGGGVMVVHGERSGTGMVREA